MSIAPTLAQRIIEIARRDQYVQGQHLPEINLCTALNVSRTPVRRALRVLEEQGIVRAIPRKGFHLCKSASDLGAVTIGVADASDEDLYLRIAYARMQAEIAQEVSESDLMTHFDAPRLQIQRVLHRMAKESLIDRKLGRGWVFRPLLTDSASYRESYRFRMVIEPAALLEPNYEPDLIELDKCRKEQEELLAGGIERCTSAELYRTGVHLHETIVAGAKNRFLLESLRSINQMRRIMEYGTKLDRTRLHRQCQEHLVLIDLLVRGERMEAAHFLRQHLDGARISKA